MDDRLTGTTNAVSQSQITDSALKTNPLDPLQSVWPRQTNTHPQHILQPVIIYYNSSMLPLILLCPPLCSASLLLTQSVVMSQVKWKSGNRFSPISPPSSLACAALQCLTGLQRGQPPWVATPRYDLNCQVPNGALCQTRGEMQQVAV